MQHHPQAPTSGLLLLLLLLVVCAAASRLAAAGQQEVGPGEAPQPGAMLSMGSESAAALESSASLVNDDLMAAESAVHASSVEPLLAVEPQHKPGAQLAPIPRQQYQPVAFPRVAPMLAPQQQQQQHPFNPQRVGPLVGPHHHHQPQPQPPRNPYALAAALAGNYGPAQQQLAAAALARHHPAAQQQLHHQHQMAAQESSVRQNVVPAPNFPQVDQQQQQQLNSIEQSPAPSAASEQVAAASVQQPVVLASQPAGNQELGSWPLQAPDIPKIVNLEVKCEKNLMKVSVEFDKAFNGLIFSKGHYNQGQCVHVAPNTGKQQAYFDISINTCGTQGNTQNGLYGMGGNTGSGTFFENTIVIQYDPNVQEVYDHARKLRCTWHDQYEKAVTFRPFPVDMLDIVRADFAGDNVGCWMQIQVGKGPWASEVAGIVKIGQTMTMVLAIKDEENKFDMLVRNCFAHDGKRGPIELVDKSGCITRPKLMSRFTKIKNFGSSATVLSYAHFQAFKFPDSMEVHFQCTIQICRHQCPDQCSSSSSGGSAGALGGASSGSGNHPSDAYSESTISGTMSLNGGGADHQQPTSIHLRKYGSAANALSRARRDTWSSQAPARRNGSQSATQTVGLNRVIQVVSTGDLAFALPQLRASADQQVVQGQAPEPSAQQQQVCVSSYSFVLGLVLLGLILLCSSLAAVAIYLRQRRQLAHRSQSKQALAPSSPAPPTAHVPSHQAHLYAAHHHLRGHHQ